MQSEPMTHELAAQVPLGEGLHAPAFCVWELVPVWHEQQAWVRFLESARDDAAVRLWLEDCYAGTA